jgi:hypothetical protein
MRMGGPFAKSRLRAASWGPLPGAPGVGDGPNGRSRDHLFGPVILARSDQLWRIAVPVLEMLL